MKVELQMLPCFSLSESVLSLTKIEILKLFNHTCAVTPTLCKVNLLLDSLINICDPLPVGVHPELATWLSHSVGCLY